MKSSKPLDSRRYDGSIAVLAFMLILLFIPNSTIAEAGTLPIATVVISPDYKIEAEIANTDESRARGLMFRKTLPEDAGMLFFFEKLDYHSFWMKNTLIPLDIIWLNERKEIVYFLTAEPCRKDPCTSLPSLQKSKYVLEVNAGFVKKHGLQIGNRLEFSMPQDPENQSN